MEDQRPTADTGWQRVRYTMKARELTREVLPDEDPHE
jgi:hypothetical protein